MSKRLDVIALDLEGTLISNAVSQIARPHLFEFLTYCRAIVPRVVIYTAVDEVSFRDVAKRLAVDGFVPQWLETIEYVSWYGQYKDLTAIPAAPIDRTILIDDFEDYVLPEQRRQWIPIRSYASPYSADDAELKRIMEVLQCEWGCLAG